MSDFEIQCPVPYSPGDKIELAHGGGGLKTKRLIDGLFRAVFQSAEVDAQHDAAYLSPSDQEVAVTTDTFVVSPADFPGGDIGSLAIHGTVNDLAMAGARPRALTIGFVLEEGLPLQDLQRYAESAAKAARTCGVPIVGGDTKVVEKGKADKIFINTTGIGTVIRRLDPTQIQAGDKIIVSGDIGRHGMAVMARREGIEFETELESDSAPLHREANSLAERGLAHCLRDATRGGLATVLNELAESAGLGVRIEENKVPVHDQVHGLCEILGLNPLYVACEGRFVAAVPPEHEDAALASLADYGNPATIGAFTKAPVGRVVAVSPVGVDRYLDMLSGEQLPRIC